jgi:protoheme IX farnesyltransferase
LVLFTVGSGAVIAGCGSVDFWVVAHAVMGTALVACAASILNQLHERDTDALMVRTAERPLPTGRVAPWEALFLGFGGALLGSVYLASAVNALSAGIALLSFFLYVFVYTPLKRVTSLNTVVGAVPGALPPMIGWSAVSGTLDINALWLFLILFLWQFPHFFAIAWMHQEDYARAGLRMLPTTPLGRRMTGWQMVSFCLVLIPVSIAPVLTGSGGTILLVGSLVMGLQFLGFSIAFLVGPSRPRARLVLFSSLFYLPIVLALWMLDATRAGA